MRHDEGAGVVLALALIGAVVLSLLAVMTLGAALVTRQRVIGGADAAAVAAADGASGAIAGEPCELAAKAAAANRVTLQECSIDGLVATVGVSAGFGLVPVTARSTAGPPP